MKKVYVSSHGPLALGGTVGWEDVWLRVCSGKRTLRLAPCLMSREDLRSTLHIYERIANDPDAATREFHRQESLVLAALLQQLDSDGYVVGSAPRTTRRGRDPGRAFALADVYTKAAWVDRAEAERMLDHYLGVIGLRGCRYKWKRPAFVSTPVTIPMDDAEPMYIEAHHALAHVYNDA